MDLTTPRADMVIPSQVLPPMPDVSIPADTTPEGSAPNTPNVNRRTDEPAAGDDSFTTLRGGAATDDVTKISTLQSPILAGRS